MFTQLYEKAQNLSFETLTPSLSGFNTHVSKNIKSIWILQCSVQNLRYPDEKKLSKIRLKKGALSLS